MVSGQLKCLGSATHLRSRFGNGYQLDINTRDTHIAAARDWILHQFVGSSILEAQGRNLKFRLTKALSLANIFRYTITLLLVDT
jgi:hypothetical protein